MENESLKLSTLFLAALVATVGVLAWLITLPAAVVARLVDEHEERGPRPSLRRAPAH